MTGKPQMYAGTCGTWSAGVLGSGIAAFALRIEIPQVREVFCNPKDDQTSFEEDSHANGEKHHLKQNEEGDERSFDCRHLQEGVSNRPDADQSQHQQ